ncbi:MAG: protein phosphatase CheZ [Alphaproteobacteria bacterium]|nr:protein phosphatase CheZ [Alphaproteobacteria bacterium]MBF0251501.1 protein phosphatase CheZ [Alphaproteobacteria bacterium]
MTNEKLFSAERRLMEKRGLPIPKTAPAPAPQPQPAVATKEVLNAIAEVKKLIEDLVSAAPAQAQSVPETLAEQPEMHVLRGQLHDLKSSIEKTKREIAAIHRPGEAEDKFVSAALELDAIVRATEVATNNILGAAEDIESHVQEIKSRIHDDTSHEHLGEISNLVIGIFENCNFQDITGQRIGKVITTINYLEDRILTMINIWGEEEFAGFTPEEDKRSADEKLLEGPQLEGQGISQDDIDALFD